MRLNVKHLIILAVGLLVLTQLTRFENTLVIHYDSTNFSAALHDATLQIELPNDTFSRLNASVQVSQMAHAGIRSVVLQNENAEIVYEKNVPVFYLFGQDLLGNLITAEPAAYNWTFGDWVMDRFMTPEIILYNQSFPQQFSLQITFVGRGYHAVWLSGNEGVYVNFADGVIDSMLGICSGDCHSISTFGRERIFDNILRIINFFAEALLIAVILLLIIQIIHEASNE